MDNYQENIKTLKNDEQGDIIEVENDDNDTSDKKRTYRYLKLYDNVKHTSNAEKRFCFFKTFMWLLVSIFVLVSIIFLYIKYFGLNVKASNLSDQGEYKCMYM